MKLDKERTTALIGDCTLKTPNNSTDVNLENVIKTELYFVLEELYSESKTSYLISLVKGFGLSAAESVLEFSKEHPAVTLTVIVPTLNHHHTYSESVKIRYQTILDRADSVIVLEDIDSNNDEPHSKLNNLLIANSSEIIVYSDGNDSEITSIVMSAERENLEMFNLYDVLEDYFSIQYPAKQFLQKFPNVQSFRYGREGVIFEGNNGPHPVHFGEIKAVGDKGGNIEFTLIDNLKIKASIATNDCTVNVLQQLCADSSKIS